MSDEDFAPLDDDTGATPGVEPIVLHCPYCGEAFETLADPSAGSQHYVEDCAVCCRPIEVRLRVSDTGELLDVQTSTDRD